MILERAGFSGRYVLSPYPCRVARALPSFATEFLDLLGIWAERVHLCVEPTVFRSVLYATKIKNTDDDGVIEKEGIIAYPDVLFTLRERLLGTPSTNLPGLGSRLWLERRDSRVVVNREEVYACLARYGFTAVDMAELSVAQQLAADKAADVLAGPHGAALAHCMFARERSSIIECFSPDFVNPYILDFCHHLRHRYFQIVPHHRANTPNAYPHAGDVLVDCDHLEIILRSLDDEGGRGAAVRSG